MLAVQTPCFPTGTIQFDLPATVTARLSRFDNLVEFPAWHADKARMEAFVSPSVGFGYGVPSCPNLTEICAKADSERILVSNSRHLLHALLLPIHSVQLN